MKKVLVISNPYSGKNTKFDCNDTMKEILYSAGYDPIFIKTKYRGHAEEMAKNVDGVDLIISDGGDGTLHEVVTGNLKRQEPLMLAHIPTGTTNDVGKLYGYNNDKISSLIKIINGEEKEVDFFSINNNPFVYVTGAGQFLHIPYSTSKEDKNKLGHLAYIKDGVKSWAEGTKLYPAMYEIDGKKYYEYVSIALFSNSTRIAGFNGFYNNDFVKLDDGLFEVMIANINKKQDLVKAAYKLIRKDIRSADGVKVFKTDNFRIQFFEPLLHDFCIDGERLNEEKNSTREYNIGENKKIKMLLPSTNISKLFK